MYKNEVNNDWIVYRIMFQWMDSFKTDKVSTKYEKTFRNVCTSIHLVNTCSLNTSQAKYHDIFSFRVRVWSYMLVCQAPHSKEVLLAICLVNKIMLTKWIEVWTLRKVFSYFVETLSVLKEPIHLNIILFNHYFLHFCT